LGNLFASVSLPDSTFEEIMGMGENGKNLVTQIMILLYGNSFSIPFSRGFCLFLVTFTFDIFDREAFERGNTH